MGFIKLPQISRDFVGRQKYFLLFETCRFSPENRKSYILINPLDIIRVTRFSQVTPAFRKIERLAKRYYLAGYFSYELGYYFEREIFRAKNIPAQPLINLCVVRDIIEFDHASGRLSRGNRDLFSGNGFAGFHLGCVNFNYAKAEYCRRVKRIKEYIRRGDTYQVNFTGKFNFKFQGDPFSFYAELKKRQNVSYAAFCKFGDEYVISLSPELYLRRHGQDILSQPMKGTIERGRNGQEDKEKQRELKLSGKNKAENLMIVDLVRNDLGRIAQTSKVNAPKMFCIDRYNTLFQMTSIVKARLREDVSYLDIFKSFFPGGSVTGAPKIRTMQIIEELEKGRRGVYCGALGLIMPHNQAVFNIPIRTIQLCGNKGQMGIGSGVVIDSQPAKEYAECLLKAKFLTGAYTKFRLIETILWDKRFKFLAWHLERLEESARYFSYPYRRAEIIRRLKQVEKKFLPNLTYRLRLLLDEQGRLHLWYSRFRLQEKKIRRAVISRHRLDPGDIFLYHKTTRRELYDKEYRFWRRRGYFDVIFRNRRNEFTEGAISNIIIQKGGQYFTPPVSSGLLCGIFRRHLIGKLKVREKVIYLADIKKAERVFLCNCLRGLTEVKISNVYSCRTF